jgi:uncharacterized protein YfaT (DUF1175 family)
LSVRAFFLSAVLLGGGVLAHSFRASTERGVTAGRDSDADGYPDVAELVSEDDRQAFVASFTAVALQQAAGLSPSFEPSQRDCAGLVRFAYREALKEHGAAFASRHPGLPRLPEVRAFHYPDVPLLGTRIFRAVPGPYSPAQATTAFDTAPEAVRLAMGSAVKRDGLPGAGDLLLFQGPAHAHLMIAASDEDDPLLVYHTGPIDGAEGEVRRARFSSLLAHRDPAWRPSPTNRFYAGVFRFKILEGP